MRPLPPSTGSTGGRASLSSSIRSYATNLSLRPGETSGLTRPSENGSNDGSTSLEDLPTELLEAIFLLAIQTSFPVEDPNWPNCPMFSKRSYHSPSNSGSGYGPGSMITGTPASGNRARTTPTPTLLTSAPHLLPTVLSQTCRCFRSVLRHAPHLWTYLNVTRTISPHQGQQPLLARQILGWLPIYLARSREAPLRITFDTTKFGSFAAPLSHSNTPATHGNAVHPQSILALLLPALSRWSSITILTSHIGSVALMPLLELLSPLALPRLCHLRLAADIWRPGIVGYGTPVPRLFAGGCLSLDSVVLEGLPLDWKSCAGVGLESGSGLFSSIKNLELRFIAGRYPRWEQFAILLEEGCPQLERLVVRDDFDEALRTLDPPPLPWFEEHVAPSIEGSGSASGRTSSISGSSRLQGHIAGLHITLPPSNERGRGRAYSTSSSSSSSGSSSASSSPTSPHHPHSPRKHRHERQFRKIHLPTLKRLEVHAFTSNASRSNLAVKPSPAASSTPQSIARFLYLFSTPSIHTLAISGLDRDGWLVVAGMLGLPADTRVRAGASGTFPLLATLMIELDSQ
ncbi:hypothetical protein FA13DRAFT_333551 [Coprinellus micaceus]|uniref:F-box domain-containing protein n=1 Tax=Coprinellus micaceus TaxID=71717 RepID=A0A4Y7TDE1_COPMI|nr:hypothetical protein FA13DRAFT_333551 [Coprinellus micaceus]